MYEAPFRKSKSIIILGKKSHRQSIQLLFFLSYKELKVQLYGCTGTAVALLTDR
eukprot:COSAG05_NODE_462_length_9561_cov_5.923378_1_plen_54_part_00